MKIYGCLKGRTAFEVVMYDVYKILVKEIKPVKTLA